MMKMYIEQLYTNCLSEAAYYIESDGEAAIIDPLRETLPYVSLANRRGARIKYVLETHFHADFVSGHIDLARETGATIVFGPGADTNYAVHNASDGELLKLGKISLTVLHTPGHTPESTCFLLKDENGKASAVFTGDTLFVGDVGRPDLLDGAINPSVLAGQLFDSLNAKIKTLPDDVIVYPAHGPGSACGRNIGKETFSTIGEQRKFNYALKATDRASFVRDLVEGMPSPPPYFFEDARINKAGYFPIADVIRENKQPLTVAEFKKKAAQDSLILDTRDPESFEKGFVPGSLNIGLTGQYAVWVGTLVDIHQPLVLITDPGKEEESVLRLARVGYENVKGYLAGGIAAWDGKLDNVDSISAEDLRTEIEKGANVLDVRKPTEWAISHLRDAQFLPLAGMPDNLSGLDRDQSYVVHCGGGYRSMIAISFMKKQGFTRLVNLRGGFNAMQAAGLEMVLEEAVV